MSFYYYFPDKVSSLEDCYFYHVMDLPTVGTVGTGWDLRNCVDDYLGNYDFKGKRALDMGTASGFLSFEMEKRGADVVSFDIGRAAAWDYVPHYKLRDELDLRRAADATSLARLKRAYWYAHQRLGSKAKAYYGDIYDLPRELGSFDVVVYGMILTHLRDPFQALYQGARLCTDTMIVTGMWLQDEEPKSLFRPHPEKEGALDVMGWWLLSIGTLRSMLGVLGFKIERIVQVEADLLVTDTPGKRYCQAIVATRV